VLFFLGLLVLLYRFLNGPRRFVDHRLSRLGNHFGGRGRRCLNRFNRSCSGSQLSFLLQTLGFTLATTHFTRVVRRTATWRQGADRSGLDDWRRRFGNYRSFNDRRFNHRRRSRFRGGNHRLGNHGFGHLGLGSRRWCFSDGWLGHPVERRLLFTHFANGFSHCLDDSFCSYGRYFNHWSRLGSRFNGPDRGAWYAGFELETSQEEVVWHKSVQLAEVGWWEDSVTYDDYLADVAGEFHDLRNEAALTPCLDPDSYVASQELAQALLDQGSVGVVYRSVRRPGGTCLACFRPAVASYVRKSARFRFTWAGEPAPRITLEEDFLRAEPEAP